MEKIKKICIIQARMDASRLPGKMLLLLAGKPALAYVIERAKRTKLIDEIWVATTNDKKDDRLARFAKQQKVKVFRGSEDDVLDRFYQTAKAAKVKEKDVIVRLTGDCPLIDPEFIDKVIKYLIKGQYDFVTNCVPPSLPDGLDVEAVTFKTLEKIWRQAQWASEREHAFSYIVRHEELFKIGRVINKKDYSSYRLTLDYLEDQRFLDLVIGACQKKKKFCGLKEIIGILESHPDWLAIINERERNEGYYKAIKKDKVIKRKHDKDQ